jgi:serine/threonine protein kinase
LQTALAGSGRRPSAAFERRRPPKADFPSFVIVLQNTVAPKRAQPREIDAMPVDAKRLKAVLAAVEGADPAHQAAILDRECGTDVETRKCVEVLLQAHRESPTIFDQPTGQFETAQGPLDGTTVFDMSASRAHVAESHVHEPVTELDGQKDDEEHLALELLQPSTKPGSLGQLGHHEVLQVLGKGGFGIVVRAFDETLHRMVAIKMLSPRLASTSPARKRFLREARASARVRHENVVQIYAVEEQPLPYLVMEYIPGQTLQQRLDQSGPLDVPYVLRIGGQVARGLAAAHEQGLIHRDVKPGNILIESGIEQKVKITDFGLARAADDASLSQSGVIAGTPLFMAPEQAKGDPPDPRADLFSLGSVLYTMVCGRPPFRAANTLAVLKRVAEDTPRPIRQIIPEAPRWLCDIIAKLHAKDPAQRFQSAAEVAVLLEQHLAHLQQPSLFARPPSVELPRLRKPRRAAIVAAAAVVLLVIGGVLTYPRWRPARPNPTASAMGGAIDAGAQAQTPTVVPVKTPATEPPKTYVLQGRASVRDALIDFAEPDRRFGGSGQDNAVRRADQCNAFLVRFNLDDLGLTPGAEVENATLAFYVWDPSSSGKTKVCAFQLTTAWDEATVTWRAPSAGKSWRGGEHFAFGADTGPAGPGVVVAPDQAGTDTVDPPIEYHLDVTSIVRSWLHGDAPNYGLAIASVFDPSVDEGILTRFQAFSSEQRQGEYSPKLTVLARR